jgi:hypothetical protein
VNPRTSWDLSRISGQSCVNNGAKAAKELRPSRRRWRDVACWLCDLAIGLINVPARFAGNGLLLIPNKETILSCPFSLLMTLLGAHCLLSV